MQMIIASIGQIGGFFGVNIYDFLVRIMGSEILRTIISFLIRQSLTHIGL